MESGPVETLAVIPARGGSKGLPGKNLALVAGKPMIAYSIEAARQSSVVDRVIVTTDCPRIAETARSCGAEIPFMRPPELATDDAPSRAVWKHAIGWLAENEGYRPARTFLLQPTSPLRTAGDLERAVELMIERRADWVVGVTRAKEPSIWLSELSDRDRLAGYAEASVQQTQRQASREVYLPNGALFLARASVLMSSERLYTEQTYAYVMPEERSVDVDSAWDLHLADLVLKERCNGETA